MSDAPLDWKDIRTNAAKFVIEFKDAKREEADKQLFWFGFFSIFGVSTRKVGSFEGHVKKLGGSDGAIDYFWPGKLIIEHKSRGKDLDSAYQQALDYTDNLSDEEFPRYIIVSDFARIRLIDLEKEQETVEIKLTDLVENIELFSFIAGYNNTKISGQHPVNIKAAEKMGKLYDLLRASDYPEEYVDKYLVRLVFCLFAEDSEIFEKNIFQDYIRGHSMEDGSNVGSIINTIFEVLNTPEDKRQKMMSDSLQEFPWVNGGLFAEQLPVAYYNREMRNYLLDCASLDWKKISPAIFGSLFQYVMNPKLRRELGAHYTSEDNILKLINPLFMDDLREEFQKCHCNEKKLRKFWDKLTQIKILDPACGCGNFLIISYRELKLLELEVMEAIYGSQRAIQNTSRITLNQFYGIELEEFPSQIAEVSMWLMDHMMNLEAREKFGESRSTIPLKTRATIICTNSLRYDWNSLVKSDELTYIIGNPPFVGHQNRDEAQIEDMKIIFEGSKKAGKLDYVCAWYKKAAVYMKGTKIKAAFVSTNSIAQGEAASIMDSEIYGSGIHIIFAYRTFVWSNEAKNVAAVHCVIIGFSYVDQKKIIFDGNDRYDVTRINCYLVDGPTIHVESRSDPINDLPEIIKGSQPTDGGNLILSKEERDELISKYPELDGIIRPFISGEDYIKGNVRYCLWLVDVEPSRYRNIPEIRERLNNVTNLRKLSPTLSVQKDALTPGLFTQIRQPTVDYLLIPSTSSSARNYLPFGFVSKEYIASNATYIIPTDDLFVFGLISSHLHLVWLDTVGGKLKSDYRYQPFIYKSFPVVDLNEEQKDTVREAAKKVLDARNKYNNTTLEDLYDPISMPKELLNAHMHLDQVVEKLYKKNKFSSDKERRTFLFDMYSKAKSN